MKKVIIHLDMDSYFVSAHRAIDKSLQLVPTVVSTGAKRSIISAASYEAKKIGINVPMPLFKALEIYPDLIILKPDFNLYTLLSSNVFDLLFTKYTNKVEIGSIDEYYLDVTEIWPEYGSPQKLAYDIQNCILKEIRIPVSLGISENKFVAKMATDLKKPFGVSVLRSKDFRKIFGDKNVQKINGIGGPTASKLNKLGIFTINELANANLDSLVGILGKNAVTLIEKANGLGEDKLNFDHNELKSIGNSLTFLGGDKYEISDAIKVLESLAESVSRRANLRNLVGNVINVGIKFTGGKEITVLHKQKTLHQPTNNQKTIFQTSQSLLENLWNEEKPIKYLEIALNQLSSIFDSTYQASIFDKTEVKNRIDNVIYQVNSKLKNKAVESGREFIQTAKKEQHQSKYLEGDRRVIKYYDKD